MQFLENIFKVVYIGLAILLFFKLMAIFSEIAIHEPPNNKTEERSRTAERIKSQTASEREQRIRSLPAAYPVSERFKISSGFGYRRDPISRQTRFHNGIDIPLRPGSRVLTTGNGFVAKTGYDGLLGNYIIINHQEYFQSIYGHLSRINVRVGERVQRGQLIALSGNTGRTTGPHLHYQVNYMGRPVDPLELVKVLNDL